MIEHQAADILALKFNPDPDPNMQVSLDEHVILIPLKGEGGLASLQLQSYG